MACGSERHLLSFGHEFRGAGFSRMTSDSRGVRIAVALCVVGATLGCKRAAREERLVPSARLATPAPSASDKVESDVVSRASEAFDAGPPVLASTKVDGAALRKRHIERLKTDRSPVTVLAGESALELGQRICEAVVPARPKWTPILVKPNICGFDGFKNPEKSGDDGVTGRITDAEFVRGVLRCLKARGHTRVTIAEGCGNSHEHWKKAIAVSGFEAMASEEGVPLVAMDDDGVYDRVGDQPGKPLAISGIERTRVPTLLMPKILAETLERGLFISAPKLKAHRYSVVSLGIKGMQGTVMRSEASPAYNQKWRMHEELKAYLSARRHKQPEDRAQYVASLELFAERMLDVLEISLPDVVLVDGAPAVAGDGFQKLRVLPGKIAIGGTNPVLVDRVGSQYLGLWDNAALAAQLGGHRGSPLIEFAARRYGVDWKTLSLTGDGVSRLKEPRPVFFKAIAPFTIEGDQAIVSATPSASSAPSADVVSTPSVASANPTPSAAPATERPSAHAARAAHAPVIDGRFEPIWQKAPVVAWDTDYAGESTGIATQARFLWDENALYAWFELKSTDLNVDSSFPLSSERPKLYQEDCVELFLAPDAARPKHYYEIELGPLGHFADLEVDRERKSHDVDWSSQLQVAATHSAERRTASIEARLGARDITSALRAGARLPFALYRMEGKGKRKYLAWSPPRTKKPNFHVPEAFGTLIVDG